MISFEKVFYKDKKTGKLVPLIGQKERALFKNIMRAAAQGFLSDPPGINLYEKLKTRVGLDDLPQYRCCRGSNAVEIWHRWLIESFKRQSIIGPKLAPHTFV